MKKYSIGFIAGVLFTCVVFMIKAKKEASEFSEPVATTQDNSLEEEYLNESPTDKVPTDFWGFYTQFHEDSAFQVNHINFPLAGIPTNIDSTTDISNFVWQRNDWQIHRPINNESGDFNQYFSTIGDKIVVENIQQKSSGFGMQRRFVRSGDSWNLIYYAGMNALSKEE